MPTILLYWEDRAYHAPLETLLRRAGHDVIATNEPAYAAQVLSRIDVDLLLLDVASEEAPALQWLEWTRTESGCQTPALVVSDLDDANLVETARQLGAADFLLKKRSLLPELPDRIDRAAGVASPACDSGVPYLRYVPA